MKAGVRAVGVAESYRGPDEAGGAGNPPRSTLAAAVVRADRVVDGFRFGGCTVGGTDATAAVGDLVGGIDRADVRYVFVAGIAPAWFNVIDLPRVAEALELPVISVSFEGSPGLEAALAREFEGPALDRRLEAYERQPARERVELDDEAVFVRASGIEPARAREAVRAFTPEGGRPEPLRVARLAARAADRWHSVS